LIIDSKPISSENGTVKISPTVSRKTVDLSNDYSFHSCEGNDLDDISKRL